MAYGWYEEEFSESFVQWMKENNVRVSEPFELSGIWRVMYMLIGHEHKVKCEEYVEYRCNNDLV